MSKLVDIYLDPAKVWTAEKERPTWLLPALLVIGTSLVSIVLYFSQIDPEWFTENALRNLPQEMGAAEREQAAMFLSPGFAMGSAIVGTLIMYPLVYVIMAVYYLLAGKVAGHEVGFARGMSLSTWASMPVLLGALVAIVAQFVLPGPVMFERLQLLSMESLLGVSPQSDWIILARSFNLLTLWSWFLAALGWKTWFRTGWGQALFVAMLPGLVIYGVIALFALL